MKKRTNNKKNNNIKLLLLFCVVILITLIIIVTSLNNIFTDDNNLADEQLQVEIQKQQEELFKKTEESVIISKLSNMEERERIEYYFSQFIKLIEDKNHEKAYEMLYDEFKVNYFPSIADFEDYAKKTFPKMMSVEHTNFERNGEVYVMFINISDSLSGRKNDVKEMKFVIKEEGLNDFVMSFSVI